MTQKEADRLHVMKLLESKRINLKKAAKLMNLSKRQTIRIKNSYLKSGVKGLISKRRGKPSPNKISDEIKQKTASVIREKYYDFGPTLAKEKLEKTEHIKMAVETIRQIMIKEGLWKSRKHKKVIVHQMRSRRSCFGELIQIDGSYHQWFENRSDKCCLLVFIDDATSKITSAKFCKHETTFDYLQVLEDHINKYGKPLSFYSDKHSVFKVNNKKNITGKEITHFAFVLKELDIELICANTPQAKGRVERANGILQDRLIKEMRLKNISSIEEGNIFLKEYLQEHNEKFSKEALCSEDAHRPLKCSEYLKEIFAHKEQRKLSKDLTFQYNGILYQIDPQMASFGMKHAPVTVINKQGNIEVRYKGQRLAYKKYSEIEYQARVVDKKAIDAWINKKTRKVNKKHPWR
jgi:transposase